MGADFQKMRSDMVEQQIQRRGVRDPATLQAMRDVPRHLFVPEIMRPYSYEDGPLSIGHGQTISQPYIVALMTEAAKLKPGDIVLEIGTGSGYAAAVLAKIVKEVYTVERLAPLAARAEKEFKEQGYPNIHVKVGDGTLGWKEHGPYDAIIVTAGAPVIPESFIDQLKLNGRVIIPVGDELGQQLLRLTKTLGSTYQREMLEYVRFVPLIGEQGWQP